jgi:adenylate cyclase
MVMGAMGSKERMDFTVIGDNVNLGSRLCDEAKAGDIILSEKSKNYIITDQFKLIKIEPIKVKGKEEPIKILKIFIR